MVGWNKKVNFQKLKNIFVFNKYLNANIKIFYSWTKGNFEKYQLWVWKDLYLFVYDANNDFDEY